MPLCAAELVDDEIGRLVRDIDVNGYAAIDGFVDPATLARMQSFVARAIDQSQGEYVAFTGAAAVQGSAFGELVESYAFRRLIERVFERGTGARAPDQGYHQVVRCLTGRGSMRHSYLFHYDSYVVTALIPVQIPAEGQPGDLLMLPNTRRIRSRYFWNVLDKILLDNRVTQSALRLLLRRGLLPVTRIRMVPGTAYFFWGYRSIHTNEPCDPDKVRATVLYHFGNPHQGAAALSGTGQHRQTLFSRNVLANAQP